jgi:hypothetical protein
MNGIAMQIFKRPFWVVAPFLLVSCNNSSDKNAGKPDAVSSEAAANDGKVECALAGSKEFSRTCDKEWIVGTKGKTLVIRHPDGGFRRFNILTDGRGLEAAEGAEKANIVTLENDMIEVSVADDRYRLLATIKASAVPTATQAPEAIKPADDKVAG